MQVLSEDFQTLFVAQYVFILIIEDKSNQWRIFISIHQTMPAKKVCPIETLMKRNSGPQNTS